MTSRNLTEVFVLMRNNAQHTKHIYSDEKVSKNIPLLGINQTMQNICVLYK